MLNSSIWPDRSAREIFITALLMAEPLELTKPIEQLEVRSLKPTGWVVPVGWYGFVPAAGIGIIHRAMVDQDAGLPALERLCLPEPESRSKRFDGRRLARVDGGFIVLNFFEYRDRDYTAAERSRRYRERVASRRDETKPSRETVTTPRDITQAEVEVEEEVTTGVCTVGEVPVRTVRETSVSTAPNENHGGGHDRRFAERRNGDGANEPGSLPRDHAKHTICGGPTSKFCLTYNQYDTLAKKYHGETPGETREAINSFYEHVKALIPEGKLPGDMVWLLQHFDAWLIQIGRIAPAPTKAKKQRRELTPEDLARIDREVKAEQAHKRNGARR